MTNRVCAYCPEPLGSHPAAVQCGAPECARRHRNARARKTQATLRATYAARGESYRNQWARPEGPRKSNTHCVDCGKPVRWGTTQETRCRSCGQKASKKRQTEERRKTREAERAKYNSRFMQARRKLTRAAAGTPASPRWMFAAGYCHRCGESFVCRVTNSLPQFCSKTCSRQEQKDRRRARELGVDIEPGQRWRIYARDGYTCQLCRKLIDRKATPESGLDFTIDHIIPLARGGAHAPYNWQTAHRDCNSRKGDRIDWAWTPRTEAA